MTVSKRTQVVTTLFALILPFIGAIGYFVFATGSGYTDVLYGLTKLAMIAWAAYWWRRLQLTPLRRNRTQTQAVVGTASGLLIFCVIVGTALLFPTLITNSLGTIKGFIDDFQIRGYFILFAIIFSLIHSAFEEWYWRGFVDSSLRALMRPPLALLTGVIAFTLHHVVVLVRLLDGPAVIVATIGVIVGGLIWTIMMRKYGFLTVWISHALADLAIFVAAFIYLS